MSDRTLLLRAFGDSPALRVVDFFLDNPSDYSKSEIVKAVGMSKTTLYNMWKDLIALHVLKRTRRYGRAELFALNTTNPVVKKMMALDWALGCQVAREATERTTAMKVAAH